MAEKKGKGKPKGARHLDDFSVKQGSAGTVPKYYGEALLEAARANDSIMALCADLTSPTETDLIRDNLPGQFVMAGIAEANMVGVAAGLARSGCIPFVHSFSVFLSRRSFDQIAMQIAYPRTNVKLVGFMPGVDSLLGVSHQATDDVALMRALPNMAVLEPASPADYRDAVQCALSHDGPMYLRMRRTTEPAQAAAGLPPLRLGRIRHARKGGDAAIFATGLMVEQALEAADGLQKEGIDAAVVDCASIKPLDADGIVEALGRAKAVVTAENHTVVGGLGSAVAEIMARNNIARPFHTIGVQDCFAEGGTTRFLFEKYGLTAKDIAAKVREGMAE